MIKNYATLFLSAVLALSPVFAQEQGKQRRESFLRDVTEWAKTADLNCEHKDGAVELDLPSGTAFVSFWNESAENDPYGVTLSMTFGFDDVITKKAFEEDYMEAIEMGTPFKVTVGENGFALYIKAAYESSKSFLNLFPYYVSWMENVLESSLLVSQTERLASDMVLVEGGSFRMGESGEESGYGVSNVPAHKVVLSSYMISKYEVTQALWEIVMDDNPSQMKGANRPVENVSWEEVNIFIGRLNQITGANYRLPTEAEWEYAARGGSHSRGYAYPGGNDYSAVAWMQDNSLEETHDVGEKGANELGLYDMGGNVSEWCSDWLGKYSARTENNPKGPASGSQKVYRGGNWLSGKEACLSSYRRGASVDSKTGARGFRLAMDYRPASEVNTGKTVEKTDVSDDSGRGGAEEKRPSVMSYNNVQVKPTFKGGTVDRFAQWVVGMAGDLIYSGSVTVDFIVNAYGKVSDVVVVKGGGGKVNEKVKTVVKSSPNWSPGRNNDKVVPVKCRAVLKFTK